MVNSPRAAAVAVALVLLPGCAATAPTYLAPGSTQMQARAASTPQVNGRVLYIADIDGQPGLGVIHVYQATMHNPQFIRDITNGAGRPFGMAVDDKNNLYVANLTDKLPANVSIFKPGASAPAFQITNLRGQPAAVAVDAHHNVYVHENTQDGGTVEVFAPNSNTASRVITTGVSGYAFEAGGMAFDPAGNLVIFEAAKLVPHVVKVAPGSNKGTPLGLNLPSASGPGLGIDKAGNIFISSQGGFISVYAPGQTNPSRTISPVSASGLLSVTSDGAVYAAGDTTTVSEIAAGANSPSNTIVCQCFATGTAVSH